MLEIIDNLYVFTTSRGRFGDIIASRTNHRPVKKDLFSELRLQDGENEFLSNAWSNARNKLFAAMAVREGRPVPLLIVRGFCGVETLGLAVEMLECDPIRLHRSLFCFGGRAISDLVFKEIENIFELQARRRVESPYLDSVCEAEKLEELAPFIKVSMYEAVQIISRLAGARIEVGETEEGPEVLRIAKQRFAGNELLGTLVIMALAAREHANNRILSVNIQRYDDGVIVESFFKKDNGDIAELGTLISNVSDAVGIIHSTKEYEDEFRYVMLPYIKEVSLLGVKANNEIAIKEFRATYFE